MKALLLLLLLLGVVVDGAIVAGDEVRSLKAIVRFLAFLPISFVFKEFCSPFLDSSSRARLRCLWHESSVVV
jgi:hypothetical protein